MRLAIVLGISARPARAVVCEPGVVGRQRMNDRECTAAWIASAMSQPAMDATAADAACNAHRRRS